MKETCKDCKNRTSTCHGTCKAYLDAVEEHNKEKAKLAKSKYLRNLSYNPRLRSRSY